MLDADKEFAMQIDPTIPRPAVAADVVVLTVVDDALRCLLVRRDDAPDADRWALPGVLLRPDETPEEAADRALRDKAALDEHVYSEQLATFGALDRDPRDRVLSIAYLALVPWEQLAPRAGLANAAAAWATVALPPDVEVADPAQLLITDAHGAPLATAFDHAHLVATALVRMRGKLDYAGIGLRLLGERFPLRDLQRVHEVVLGRALNTDSFRRRILASGRVAATGVRESNTTYRPAELYTTHPDQKQHY